MITNFSIYFIHSILMTFNRFSIGSISEFRSRPSSCKFRPTSNLTPKHLDNLISRPVTAKNSIHTWNNVGLSNDKK